MLVSYLDPLDAVKCELVEKFLREMVRRCWKEKKSFQDISHITRIPRLDISDKEYSILAWKTMHGDSSYKGCLVCLGGNRNTVSPLNATYVFRDDPNTQLIDFTSPFYDTNFPETWSAVATTSDSFGAIRTFGGFDGSTSVSSCYRCIRVEKRRVENIQQMVWRPCGQLPRPCCFASASTTCNGDIVITGGGSSLFQGASVSASTLLQRHTNDDYSMDWEYMAPMQTVRCGHSTAILPSGKMIAAGGYAGGLNYLSSTECFDCVLGRWLPLSSMKYARSGFGFGISPYGAVYSFGGSSNGSNGHDSVEMFDERVGKWEILPQKMKSGRAYLGGCCGGSGILYAAGGVRDYVACCSIEFMDPRTNKWEYLHDMEKPGCNDTEMDSDSYESIHFGRSNFTMLYSMW